MPVEPLILAIESSCDDTSAAVLRGNKVLSNIVASQKIHQKYGGVVPELASRAHQQNIIPVVSVALEDANIDKKDLSAVAFTRGPGLLGSLLVGTSFAKSLSMSLKVPLIEINHMQAHILAHFIDDEQMQVPEFPFLALTISGGHTQLVLVKDYFDMEILGETLDDAVGEAFDKTAKILGLTYPGGPLIDKYAKEGDASKFNFPIPKVDGLNFSFSGLKTNILNFITKESCNDENFVRDHMNDICASVQSTIVAILMQKVELALAKYEVKALAIGGGVAANSAIRSAVLNFKNTHDVNVHIPKFEFCTDNAAMIGIAAYFKYQRENFTSNAVSANARFKFESL
ncbi:MAG: tRNA (adenosine(37)-N6)-threonylcarbamoyltransferase complex transferase subunit TsaD [Flavobacteriaceae bacterium]|jgi:N6-L-threonylcarbamoyladenine synthase